ncbi:MAG: hypothetical protein GY940_38450 [bacterium]|nr:hypothetical protein [bacterium]
MLVIISDIHFTDGHTATNVKPEAFKRILGPRIKNAAEKNRSKEIHLVLLGDILDLVRTDYWVTIDKDQRPWNGELDRKTGMNQNHKANEKHFESVLDDIFTTDSFKGFVQMMETLRGEMDKIGVENFKLTYVMGNHDRVLDNYPSLKDKIKAKFPFLEGENFEFRNVVYAPEYGVLTRHGHEWDEITHGWEFYNKVLAKGGEPLCRFDPGIYKVMAIGEVITAELMGGLIYYVRDALKDDPRGNQLVKSLFNVNNLRPMTSVFEWLVWLMKKGDLENKYKETLYLSLRKSLSGVLDSELAKLWDDVKRDWLFSGDITDHLSKLAWLLERSNYDDLYSIIKFVKRLGLEGGGGQETYIKGAAREWDDEEVKKCHGFDMEDIQYVVYGHTHEAAKTYISGDPGGKVKTYINTGTFLPLIQRTYDKEGFAMDSQMTMVFFYNKDEDVNNRKGDGPTFEFWSGSKRKIYIDDIK